MNKISSRDEFLKALRPGAGEVGTLKYLWRHHRSDIFRQLLSFLRERPIFTLFLAYFFLKPTLLLFGLTFLAFLVSHLFNELMGQVDVLFNQTKVFRGGLLPLARQYKDLTIKEIKVSEFLTPFAYHDISFFLIEAVQRMIPFIKKGSELTLNDLVRVYVVNTNNAILQNVTSYPAPFRQSFVIFDHEPEECGPFQHFAILHEIGHIALGPARTSYFGQHGFKTMLFSLLIASLCFSIQSVGWVLIFAFYIIGYKERFHLSFTAHLRDELNCDSFAISYLDDRYWDRLRKIPGLSDQLTDPTLIPRHNAKRIEHLTKALQFPLQEKDDAMEYLMNDPSHNYKPKVLYLLIMVSVLMSIAGFVTLKPQALTVLLIAFFLLFFSFLASHVWSWIRTEQLKAFVKQFSRTDDL